jgi:hypothetical protein
MAKLTLKIVFDVIDEKGESVKPCWLNVISTPLDVDKLVGADGMWLNNAIHYFMSEFRVLPSTRHLFPQIPYGESWEPDSKVENKADRIYFETASGHISPERLREDD